MKEIPYWTDYPPKTETYTDKPLPAKTDILIIGGGYTGLNAAVTLGRAGIEVTGGTSGIGFATAKMLLE